MQTVVYSVSGEGRAISVMYLDTGDLIQTEFNVTLPWSKQVSLSTSAPHPASVTDRQHRPQRHLLGHGGRGSGAPAHRTGYNHLRRLRL